MRCLTAAVAALLAALSTALPAEGPDPSSDAETGSFKTEIELAEQALADGLYEFVALRTERLLAARSGEFPGRDRAELLLGKSDYLRGQQDKAEARLREFLKARTGSPLLDECQLWVGRIETECRGRHDAAVARLRPIYRRLTARVGTDPRLLDQIRYYLALALAGQGTPISLGSQVANAPDSGPRSESALQLLNEHIRGASILLAEAHVLRGRALYLMGRPDECFKLLQEDFLDEEVFVSSPLRSEALFWQAEARYGQARWIEAATLFGAAAAAAAGPGGDLALVARARYSRGWALMKRAEDLRRAGLGGSEAFLDDALASFDSDLSAGGQDMVRAAQLQTGHILIMLGRFKEALSHLAPLTAASGSAAAQAVEAKYLSALAHESSGQFNEAETLLSEAAAVEVAGIPADLAARIQSARGRVYYRLAGDPPEPAMLERAAGCFEAALLSRTASSERHSAWLWLARVRAAQGKPEEAVELTEELSRTLPAREFLRQDQLEFYRGDFELQLADRSTEETARLGHAAAAVEHFSEARSAGPRGEFAVPASLGSARANLMLGNDGEALRLYEEIRSHPAAKPDDVHRANLGIAERLMASRRYRKAANYVEEQLLKADPAASPELTRQALALRARCLAAADAAAEASDAYGQLGEASASDLGRTRARLERDVQLDRAGRHAEAAADLTALAGECPQQVRAEVLFRAGQALQAAGETDAALRSFVASAAMTGDFQCEALVLAAEAASQTGSHAAAESHARTAQGLSAPGSLLSVRATLARAAALLASAKHAEALDQFRLAAASARAMRIAGPAGSRLAAAEVYPLELRALLGAGDALSRLGRPEDASAAYLAAAYLRDPAPSSPPPPKPEMLERAAAALETAGRDEAAGQIRALAAERRKGDKPETPAPIR